MSRYTLIADESVNDSQSYFIERDEESAQIHVGFEQNISDNEDGRSVYIAMTHEQAYAFYKKMHRALFGEKPEWAP